MITIINKDSFNRLKIDDASFDIKDVNYHIDKLYEVIKDSYQYNNLYTISYYTIKLIDTWLDLSLYSKINDLLYRLDINKLEEWSLSTLLRSTYSAKHKLSFWQSFYESSYLKLKNEQHNEVNKILLGLDKQENI